MGCDACLPSGYDTYKGPGDDLPGWRPIGKHPSVAGAPWHRSRGTDRVVFCRECDALLWVGYDRFNEWVAVSPLPSMLLPFLGPRIDLDALVALTADPELSRNDGFDVTPLQVLTRVFDGWVDHGKHDPLATANRLVRALNAAEGNAYFLMSALAKVVSRQRVVVNVPGKAFSSAEVDRIQSMSDTDEGLLMAADAILNAGRRQRQKAEARADPGRGLRLVGAGELPRLLERDTKVEAAWVRKWLARMSQMLDDRLNPFTAPKADREKLRAFVVEGGAQA